MTEKNILEFSDLYYEVKNTDKSKNTEYVTIIKGLNGKFESGKLIGIMGSSGCGKTHLIKLLFGEVEYSAKTYGEIKYNNEIRTPEKWTKLVTFLPQDDFFYPNLSLYDSIKFYLSLNKVQNSKELDNSAIDILTKCQIIDKMDAPLSTLSGGERKRAMIALTLSNEPDIIILDEPTSGLDSKSALKIMLNLKKYAEENNKIVILSIHQPGTMLFNLIEEIYFMTQNGIFYSGPVTKLQQFFDENELKKDDYLSVSEFLFTLQDLSSPYRHIVDNIVKTNNRYSDSVKTSWKRNTKLDLPRININHIYNLVLHNLKLFWASKSLYAKFSNLLFFCVSIYFTTMYELFDVSIQTNTFYDNFIASFYKFHIFYYVLVVLNFSSGIDSRNENCFFLEITTGRYSYGSYFVYLFLQKFLYLTSYSLIALICKIIYLKGSMEIYTIISFILLILIYSLLLIPIHMMFDILPIHFIFKYLLLMYVGQFLFITPNEIYSAKISILKTEYASYAKFFNLIIIFAVSNFNILMFKYLVDKEIVKMSKDFNSSEIYKIFDFPMNDRIMIVTIIFSYISMIGIFWYAYKTKLPYNYRLKLK